jgi:hypothetical protein
MYYRHLLVDLPEAPEMQSLLSGPLQVKYAFLLIASAPAPVWLQAIQDQFGVAQIRRLEALCDLSVNRLQKMQRFIRPTFALPERGKITGRAQLPATGLLTSCNFEALGV